SWRTARRYSRRVPSTSPASCMSWIRRFFSSDIVIPFRAWGPKISSHNGRKSQGITPDSFDGQIPSILRNHPARSPHPAAKPLRPIGFESGRGQPLSGTQGKRLATFALVTRVGPEPRPARSTTGEPGRAADRQAFASLSYPANRQVLRNPHVGRPGFLVSTSIRPRTAVRRGRRAGLGLTPNCQR